jgi:uncharacterized membrane protein
VPGAERAAHLSAHCVSAQVFRPGCDWVASLARCRIALMSRPPRLPIIDALRGLAVAQMIVYHFIYDLNYFGWVKLWMNRDQPWVGWRTAIVTQFLLLVGVSLVLRAQRYARAGGGREFWLRWAQVAGAAALVSAGSWFVFGPRFIWFGILHFIAVALVIGRGAVPLGAWNIALGIGAIVLGKTFVDPLFDPTPMNIFGMAATKPRTEDYVPLFPWLGVVLIGIGLATLWQRRGFALWPWLAPLDRQPPRLLLLLGGWSLTVYLVHQPLLMGLLWLVRRASAV